MEGARTSGLAVAGVLEPMFGAAVGEEDNSFSLPSSSSVEPSVSDAVAARDSTMDIKLGDETVVKKQRARRVVNRTL